MDLKLAGKTALITGGSKGIGRATAELFAAEGCNVIIVSRTAETLAAVKSAIAQKSNVRVDAVAADLSDSKNVDRLAKDFPDIDILVNNAGAIPGGSLLNVSEETWRKAWDLKVFGYVNMCRAFYALMKKKAKDRTGSEDNWKDLFKPLPFQRGASPEEIGAAIAFLASPHSGYTSGSVVTIDAGLSARAGAF